jgi:environmental stress-induced protein Ves
MIRESATEALRPDSGSIVSTWDIHPTAWKNGAGTTREIAAYRSAGPAADFDWRISVADLTRDASFSRFSGSDRTFLVASGAGVVLDIDGASSVLNEGQSIAFSGERDVSVALPHGPATAVNLMTGRSCRGVMRVLPVEGSHSLTAATVAVLVLKGSARTSRSQILHPLDFFLCGADIEQLHFSQAVAVLIDIHRRW